MEYWMGANRTSDAPPDGGAPTPMGLQHAVSKDASVDAGQTRPALCGAEVYVWAIDYPVRDEGALGECHACHLALRGLPA